MLLVAIISIAAPIAASGQGRNCSPKYIEYRGNSRNLKCGPKGNARNYNPLYRGNSRNLRTEYPGRSQNSRVYYPENVYNAGYYGIEQPNVYDRHRKAFNLAIGTGAGAAAGALIAGKKGALIGAAAGLAGGAIVTAVQNPRNYPKPRY